MVALLQSGLAVLATIFGATSVYFGARGVVRLLEQRRLTRWTAAVGEVVDSQVVDEAEDEARVSVRFRFELDGQLHEGVELEASLQRGIDPALARELVARLPTGAHAQVRVDPARPERAVLITGFAAPMGRLWFVAGVFGVLCVVFAVLAPSLGRLF